MNKSRAPEKKDGDWRYNQTRPGGDKGRSGVNPLMSEGRGRGRALTTGEW